MYSTSSFFFFGLFLFIAEGLIELLHSWLDCGRGKLSIGRRPNLLALFEDIEIHSTQTIPFFFGCSMTKSQCTQIVEFLMLIGNPYLRWWFPSSCKNYLLIIIACKTHYNNITSKVMNILQNCRLSALKGFRSFFFP